MPSRVNIGAGRLSTMFPRLHDIFFDGTWMLLGEEPLPGYSVEPGFHPWFFKRGDKLPVEDSSMNFCFIEHFLEHLLLVEGALILEESYRILRPGGVLRVAVPDALFRPEPEPPNLGGCHKIRWDVCSLEEAIRAAGFEVVSPIRFYSREGPLVQRDAAEVYSELQPLDREMCGRADYFNRADSLIVDGLKLAAPE